MAEAAIGGKKGAGGVATATGKQFLDVSIELGLVLLAGADAPSSPLSTG